MKILLGTMEHCFILQEYGVAVQSTYFPTNFGVINRPDPNHNLPGYRFDEFGEMICQCLGKLRLFHSIDRNNNINYPRALKLHKGKSREVVISPLYINNPRIRIPMGAQTVNCRKRIKTPAQWRQNRTPRQFPGNPGAMERFQGLYAPVPLDRCR
jgi:hypothetical protein